MQSAAKTKSSRTWLCSMKCSRGQSPKGFHLNLRILLRPENLPRFLPDLILTSYIIKWPPSFSFSVVFSYSMSRPTNLSFSPLRSVCFFVVSFSLCLNSPCSVSLFPFPFDQMPCCYAVSRQCDVSGPSSRHHCFQMLYVCEKEEVFTVGYLVKSEVKMH